MNQNLKVNIIPRTESLDNRERFETGTLTFIYLTGIVILMDGSKFWILFIFSAEYGRETVNEKGIPKKYVGETILMVKICLFLFSSFPEKIP